MDRGRRLSARFDPAVRKAATGLLRHQPHDRAHGAQGAGAGGLPRPQSRQRHVRRQHEDRKRPAPHSQLHAGDAEHGPSGQQSGRLPREGAAGDPHGEQAADPAGPARLAARAHSHGGLRPHRHGGQLYPGCTCAQYGGAACAEPVVLFLP